MKKIFILSCAFIASFSVAQQKFDLIFNIDKKGSEFFKADYKNAIRSKIVQVLSNFFYQHADNISARTRSKEAIQEIEQFRRDNQHSFDAYYCAALDTLESFMENIAESDVYYQYIKLFDTNIEMADIADALTWLASSMSKLSRHKYSQETMKHIVDRKFLYRHIYLLSRIKIFSHLNYSQRVFVLQMTKLAESAIGLISLSNAPSHSDDQADLLVDGLAMAASDAKKFHKRMNEIFRNIENVKNGYISEKKVEDIGQLLYVLREMKESVYLNVINVSDTTIKPTRSMIHEIVGAINAAENYLKYSRNSATKSNQSM